MSFSPEERALALFQRELDEDDGNEQVPPGEERDSTAETREQKRARWARRQKRFARGLPFK